MLLVRSMSYSSTHLKHKKHTQDTHVQLTLNLRCKYRQDSWIPNIGMYLDGVTYECCTWYELIHTHDWIYLLVRPDRFDSDRNNRRPLKNTISKIFFHKQRILKERPFWPDFFSNATVKFTIWTPMYVFSVPCGPWINARLDRKISFRALLELDRCPPHAFGVP